MITSLLAPHLLCKVLFEISILREEERERERGCELWKVLSQHSPSISPTHPLSATLRGLKCSTGITPRGTDVAHITKCIQSKSSLDNLGNARGFWNLECTLQGKSSEAASVERAACRGRDASTAAPTEDYSALSAIYSRI